MNILFCSTFDRYGEGDVIRVCRHSLGMDIPQFVVNEEKSECCLWLYSILCFFLIAVLSCKESCHDDIELVFETYLCRKVMEI